jgi:hypothetical protein
MTEEKQEEEEEQQHFLIGFDGCNHPRILPASQLSKIMVFLISSILAQKDL